MKNIALSTDGTGNSGGKGHGTNVWRIHTAIDRNKTDKPLQLAYYHDGVGSQENKLLKIVGGALGYGMGRTIRELYFFLVNNYSAEDRIFLFGFSRGAYTVRLLAGFITSCGILNRDDYRAGSDLQMRRDIKRAYSVYKDLLDYQKRHKDVDDETRETDIKYIKSRLEDSRHDDVRIRFIGVWDTVDAYAIPSDTLARFVDKVFYTSFREHDNSLSDQVEQACHALSIDDQRRTFQPVLWRENNNADHQRIQQVWFAGVHSNVGGGYPKQGLAWVSLEWMMAKASAAGLQLVEEDIEQFRENQNVHDKLYDSRSGLGAYYAFRARDIGKSWSTYVSEKSKPCIHLSALERIARRSESYSPLNIPADFKICAMGSNSKITKKKLDKFQTEITKNIKNNDKLRNDIKPLYISEHLVKWIDLYYMPILSGLLLLIWWCYWGFDCVSYECSTKHAAYPIALSLFFALMLSLISSVHKNNVLKVSSLFWRKVYDEKLLNFFDGKNNGIGTNEND